MELQTGARKFTAGSFGLVIGAALFIFMMLASWYTIDQGERGVILRTGAVVGTAEPGLHFKVPFLDKVVKLSVQSRKVTFEKMSAYSRDQQPADLVISVNYRIVASQVESLYADYGSEQAMADRLISPRVNQESKTVFGQFNAVTAIQDRERLNASILKSISEKISGGVLIESVQVENIDFSNAYEQSIEQRMLAEVEVQKVKQNWEREKIEADIVRTKAQAQADAQVSSAKAEAESILLRGKSEALAIDLKGKALRDNPSLINLVQAEKWNGVLPVTMLPNSTVPMLNVK